MQNKICEKLDIPVTKYDLVVFTKKLWPNLDCQPKSSLPIDF